MATHASIPDYEREWTRRKALPYAILRSLSNLLHSVLGIKNGNPSNRALLL